VNEGQQCSPVLQHVTACTGPGLIPSNAHKALFKNRWELGVVAHVHNSSTKEAEAGGSGVQGQPGQNSETFLKKNP
jgi:hypothetical protein